MKVAVVMEPGKNPAYTDFRDAAATGWRRTGCRHGFCAEPRHEKPRFGIALQVSREASCRRGE
jgi:hypothetical protein